MKRLIWFPLLIFALALLRGALPGDSGVAYGRAIGILVPLVTALSALVTAATFTRFDRLFYGWLLIGVGYVCNMLLTAVPLLFHLPPTRASNVNLIILLVGNIALPLALWIFVRAWYATGLAAPASPSAHRLSVAAGIVAAIVIGGYPLARAVLGAETDLILLISTASDMIAIALIVPLAMPALALRGGSLMYTWGHLAAGSAVWLLYDLWAAVRTLLVSTDTLARVVQFALAMTAITFTFAATIAQRRAVRF